MSRPAPGRSIDCIRRVPKPAIARALVEAAAAGRARKTNARIVAAHPRIAAMNSDGSAASVVRANSAARRSWARVSAAVRRAGGRSVSERATASAGRRRSGPRAAAYASSRARISSADADATSAGRDSGSSAAEASALCSCGSPGRESARARDALTCPSRPAGREPETFPAGSGKQAVTRSVGTTAACPCRRARFPAPPPPLLGGRERRGPPSGEGGLAAGWRRAFTPR